MKYIYIYIYIYIDIDIDIDITYIKNFSGSIVKQNFSYHNGFGAGTLYTRHIILNNPLQYSANWINRMYCFPNARALSKKS